MEMNTYAGFVVFLVSLVWFVALAFSTLGHNNNTIEQNNAYIYVFYAYFMIIHPQKNSLE